MFSGYKRLKNVYIYLYGYGLQKKERRQKVWKMEKRETLRKKDGQTQTESEYI